MMSQGHYENGIPTGFWKFYYPDGKLEKEGNFTDGIAHGFWSTFYENGNARTQGQMRNCLPQGFWKFFYEDKNYGVEYEGTFDNGTRTGTWKHYQIGGKLLSTQSCD